MQTDTVGGLEHTVKLFSGADADRIPKDKQMVVAKETFARMLDKYHHYLADRWANGTVYYDWPHDHKDKGAVIAVRLYKNNKGRVDVDVEYIIHKDYFLK